MPTSACMERNAEAVAPSVDIERLFQLDLLRRRCAILLAARRLLGERGRRTFRRRLGEQRRDFALRGEPILELVTGRESAPLRSEIRSLGGQHTEVRDRWGYGRPPRHTITSLLRVGPPQ